MMLLMVVGMKRGKEGEELRLLGLDGPSFM